jgi:porin
MDGGLAYKGLIGSRGDDVTSFGIAYASISGRIEQLVGDLQRIGAKAGLPFRTPDYEGLIEINYQASLAPWWTMQPDIQMVLHPTPAVVRPTLATPLPRMGNAFILGLRTSVRF